MTSGVVRDLTLGAAILLAIAVAGCDSDAPTGTPLDRSREDVPPNYGYTIIDVAGATATSVHGANAWGDLVGSFTDARGVHGFLIRDGTVEAFDVSGATATQPRGINERGDIVGFYNAGGKLRGFVRRNGEFATLEGPNAAGTRLWAINDDGVIAGEYQAVGGGAFRAFTWRNGEFTPLDIPGATMSAGYGINRRGEVVGHYTLPGSAKMFGFNAHGSAFTQFNHPESGTQMSCAAGIGDKGEVVGHYQEPGSGVVYGYLWRGGSFVDTLRVPGAMETYPRSITALRDDALTRGPRPAVPPFGPTPARPLAGAAGHAAAGDVAPFEGGVQGVVIAGYFMDAQHRWRGFVARAQYPWGTKF